MYREVFLNFLKSYDFSTALKPLMDYVVKNEESGYLRAQLVLAWCDVFGGKIEEALPLALAIECIQSASLIQDDLPCMDNAITRRNKSCLHLYSNEANAILTSDMLLIEPFRIVNNSNLSNYQKNLIISLLINTMHQLGEGQYLEFQNSSPTLNSLLKINNLKTASLFSCCCQLGAIVASVNEEDIERAGNYGKRLGLLYQIIDDIKDRDGIFLLDNNQELKNTITCLKDLLENEANLTQNQLLLEIKDKLNYY